MFARPRMVMFLPVGGLLKTNTLIPLSIHFHLPSPRLHSRALPLPFPLFLPCHPLPISSPPFPAMFECFDSRHTCITYLLYCFNCHRPVTVLTTELLRGCS